MIKIEFDNVVKSLAGKVDSPRLEGRIIMGYVLKKDDNEIIPKTYTLTIEQHKQLESIIKQRSQGCPLDKIIGEKDFYKYRFKVSQDVLSPRPDTSSHSQCCHVSLSVLLWCRCGRSADEQS